MSDYLERLIASSLDPGGGRDDSTVVRPRRAAPFEPTAPGDRALLDPPSEADLSVEEIAEETVSRPVPPTGDSPPFGPAWERGRPGRFVPSDALHTRRLAPLPTPQPREKAPIVDLRPSPLPDVPSASPTTPLAAQETPAPAPTRPAQQDAVPGASFPSVPAEPHRQMPARRPIAPAAEQQIESTVPRREAAPRIISPAAAHGEQGRQDVRSAPAPAPSSAGPMPGNVPRPAPAVTFVEAVGSASPVAPAAPGDRPRTGRAGRTVEPAVRAPRVSESSSRIEPSSVEAEARPRQEPATTIVVSIGRIEVRAPSAPPDKPARPRQPAPRRAPALSLDAYLDQRNGARR